MGFVTVLKRRPNILCFARSRAQNLVKLILQDFLQLSKNALGIFTMLQRTEKTADQASADHTGCDLQNMPVSDAEKQQIAKQQEA